MKNPKPSLPLLAKMLCAVEGKKHQVNIADMSEILNRLCVLIATLPVPILLTLIDGAAKRTAPAEALRKALLTEMDKAKKKARRR